MPHIGTGLHYPLPLHLQAAYANSGHRQGDFPVSERIASEILSLPMYPQLSSARLTEISFKISEFLAPSSIPRV
jgi:dTDP-4-amino-4,6-dideoxygalactose transaminase